MSIIYVVIHWRFLMSISSYFLHLVRIQKQIFFLTLTFSFSFIFGFTCTAKTFYHTGGFYDTGEQKWLRLTLELDLDQLNA